MVPLECEDAAFVWNADLKKPPAISVADGFE
jgi:hypothetical protein